MSTAEVTDERVARATSGPLLGMVLFVASEAMFFAAFFGAYFTIRASQTVWPPRGVPHLKIEIAVVLTVILVSSSVVLQVAGREMRASGPRRANILLALTI